MHQKLQKYTMYAWDFYEKLDVDRFVHFGSSGVKATRDLV